MTHDPPVREPYELRHKDTVVNTYETLESLLTDAMDHAWETTESYVLEVFKHMTVGPPMRIGDLVFLYREDVAGHGPYGRVIWISGEKIVHWSVSYVTEPSTQTYLYTVARGISVSPSIAPEPRRLPSETLWRSREEAEGRTP